MTEIEGLEEVFSSEIGRIRSRADCAVAALHCMLINEHLECLGVGEKSEGAHLTVDQNVGTQLLPEKWNDNQQYYALRYASEDGWNIYQLRVTPADERTVNVSVTANDDHVYEVTLQLDDFLAGNYDAFQTTYINLRGLADSIQSSILDRMRRDEVLGNRENYLHIAKEPFMHTPSPTTRTGRGAKQTTSVNSRGAPTSKINGPEIHRPRNGENKRDVKMVAHCSTYTMIPHTPVHHPQKLDSPMEWPKVGENDLDPLGRGHGTMHFDADDLEDSLDTLTPRNPIVRQNEGKSKADPFRSPDN